MILPTISYAESNYTKLTTEEAEEWLKTITYEELLDFIIEWDYIEHTIPELSIPRYVAVVKDDDVYLQPEFSESIYSHGYLSYTFYWPEYTYTSIIPKEDHWQIDLAIGLGSAIGGLVLGGWLGWELHP